MFHKLCQRLVKVTNPNYDKYGKEAFWFCIVFKRLSNEKSWRVLPMQITSKQINEIARELEAGMKVFMNRELWFGFRTKKYEDYVRLMLYSEGIICE